MSNNFRKTAFLKKNMNFLTKDSLLRVLTIKIQGVICSCMRQNNFVFFFVCKHFSSFGLTFPGKNCRQIYGKSNTSVWRNLSTFTTPKFVSKILCCSFSLQFSFFFFRTAVLLKLFDITFSSYKHCNFSRGYLLVKMAFKTVTRTLKLRSLYYINID